MNFDRLHDIAYDAVDSGLALVKSEISSLELLCVDGREYVTKLDLAIHATLSESLKTSGLDVFSEEASDLPTIPPSDENSVWWVIDPLDGSFNMLSGFGPSNISVALMRGGKPVFGLLGSVNSDTIVSSKDLMPFSRGDRTSAQNLKVLYTGIPSRASINNSFLKEQTSFIEAYSKVRMIGCASESLKVIALYGGLYYERDIALWDVAAGLAMVKARGMHYVILRQQGWLISVVAGSAEGCEELIATIGDSNAP